MRRWANDAEKVCGREKKTDVFSGKGATNEERKPRVPSCPPPTPSPTSLHVGSFCMSDSVIPGGQNGLSLSLCLSPSFFLPLLLYVCAVTVSQAWLVLCTTMCCKRGLRGQVKGSSSYIYDIYLKKTQMNKRTLIYKIQNLNQIATKR